MGRLAWREKKVVVDVRIGLCAGLGGASLVGALNSFRPTLPVSGTVARWGLGLSSLGFHDCFGILFTKRYFYICTLSCMIASFRHFCLGDNGTFPRIV